MRGIRPLGLFGEMGGGDFLSCRRSLVVDEVEERERMGGDEGVWVAFTRVSSERMEEREEVRRRLDKGWREIERRERGSAGREKGTGRRLVSPARLCR